MVGEGLGSVNDRAGVFHSKNDRFGDHLGEISLFACVKGDCKNCMTLIRFAILSGKRGKQITKSYNFPKNSGTLGLDMRFQKWWLFQVGKTVSDLGLKYF